MRYGGLLVVLALVVGTVGGYAGARELRTEPVTVAHPQPIPAEDPATPVDIAGLLPDSPVDPVDPDLPLHEEFLAQGPRRVAVPAPAGWERINLRPGEARWVLPGNPPGSYSVRVRTLSGRERLDEMVLNRSVALRGDPTIGNLRLRDNPDNTAALSATFVKSGYLKVTLIRWINFHGAAAANLEIAWTGRLIDEAAMQTLTSRMVADARPAPAPTDDTAGDSAGDTAGDG